MEELKTLATCATFLMALNLLPAVVDQLTKMFIVVLTMLRDTPPERIQATLTLMAACCSTPKEVVCRALTAGVGRSKRGRTR